MSTLRVYDTIGPDDGGAVTSQQAAGSGRRRRWLMVGGVVAAGLIPAAPALAVPQFVLAWGSPGAADNQFTGPSGVTTDAAGNVYVADQGNSQIMKFTATGDLLGKTAAAGPGPGQLASPRSVATDAAGNAYVSDSSNNRIQKLTSSLVFVREWTGSPATTALNFPADLAVDAGGSVYVADRDNSRIAKFTGDGVFQTSWLMPGATPTGVAVEPNGNILVTAQSLNAVHRFTPTGSALTGFGSGGATAGQFNAPAGIATDAVGNIYVADQSNNRIQKFAADGSFVATWGGVGSAGGQFQSPLGVTVDSAGNIYVADTANHRIQKFVEPTDLAAATPAPVTTTVGSTVTLSVGGANAGPGVAFASKLNLTVPSGVTILSASPSQGTCSVAGQTVTCILGPVAAAAAPGATVTLRADAPVSGNSVVTLTTPTAEASASNNAASGQIVVSSPAPTGPGGGTVPRVTAQLRFRAALGTSGARFLTLTVIGAPKGARVRVSCARGCGRKATRIATGRRVDLVGVFRGRALRVGSVIEVRVTRPGAVGRLFRLSIRRSSIARTDCSLRATTGAPFSCTRL